MRLWKMVALWVLSSAVIAVGQQSTSSTIPPVIEFRSTLRGFHLPANATRTVGITFAIYAEQEGGAPLWIETQNVLVDGDGRYSVILGSMRGDGIPADLFSGREARWLGVKAEGHEEEARVLLASVPYAFRAREAETLGGLPASAFVTLDSVQTPARPDAATTAPPSIGTQSAGSRLLPPTLGHGTKGFVSMWLNTVYIGNSALFQDTNQNIGLGTASPAAKLDVNGSVNASTSYLLGGATVLTAGVSSANLFTGFNAGAGNTTGSNNTGTGDGALKSNTSGTANTAQGAGALQSNSTGNNNIALGHNAGANNATGSFDVYIGNQGPTGVNESNTIRIGDPANHTTAYIAGINGASTNSGVPVFIDSTGKLGTGGGAVNFSQVTGTLTSPQFTGTYINSVTLSNAANIFNGSFTGNGSGLSGVSSGLSWPIIIKSADYAVQTIDFSTPSSYGNYLILTGSVAHTFTLPNPAPPNGSCVAIGNVAGAPIASNTNVFLTVSGNGLQIEGNLTNGTTTQPRRHSYLYCSDGVGYWRLNRQIASPSQIGPVLYTVDTGVQDAMKTTFVAGLDFGLNTGTTIFILPIHPNATTSPTLDVNGLGAKRIARFGNQHLAPGDLSTTALAVLIYDGLVWQLVNPQTVAGTVTSVTATAPLVSTGGTAPNISCPTCITMAALTGTTGTIGGSLLSAGSCTNGTATVTGAVVGHPVAVSASDGSLPNGFIILSAAVTSPNTVTVQLCATGNVTPAANTYNVTTQ
jgi:hypothetical protein